MADRFVKGTLILTAAGLMVKILASVNRIFLSRLLGGEGIGLYQLAYPLYNLLVGIVAAGIPAAMSLIVARYAAKKEWGSVHRVVTVSFPFLALLGLAVSLAAYGLIPCLFSSGLIKDERALVPMLFCVPALLLTVPLAGLRGYFQGFQEMRPTALSQILEQFFRVAFMLVLSVWLLPKGLAMAAGGAIFGVAPGALMGLLFLLFCYRRQQLAWKREGRDLTLKSPISGFFIIRELVSLALPVTLSTLMIPLVGLVEIILVPDRLLAAGFTVAASTTALGYLTGMAMPLVNMGTIPTNSLAWSTVPAISEAYALGDSEAVRNKARTALRILILFTLPAAVGMYLLGTPISQVLYGMKAAGPVVSFLAPSVFFLGLHQVTAAILQGLGRPKIPMLNMFLGLAVKIGVLWIFAAQPQWNVIGAALATDLGLALSAFMNLAAAYRLARIALPVKTLLRALMASLLMGGAALWVNRTLLVKLGLVTSTLGAVGAGALLYGFLLLVLGEGSLRALKKKRRHHG